MKNKLASLLIVLAALLTSGLAENFIGRRRVLSVLSSAFETPQFLAAMALGNSGECDMRAYRPTMNLRWLPDEIAKLKHSSRLKQKTAEGFHEWETPEGVFWTPDADDPFWVLGEQIVDVYETKDHMVQPGDVVLDAGANVGVFTRKALQRGARLVVAIEPVPDLVECLRRTFAKEIAEQRVIVLPKGVWHEESTLKMNLFRSSALDSFVMKDRVEEGVAKREVELPLTTIDHLVSELQLPKIDFIKMDIEGAERNALRGAADSIRKYHPRLSVATENLDDDYSVLPKVMQEIEPRYTKTCGACRMITAVSMRPDIVFFDIH